MIKRALSLDISVERKFLLIRLYLFLFKSYYPQILIMTILSILYMALFDLSLFYSTYVFMFIQIFLLSISCHEYIHIRYAQFLKYEVEMVSVIPYLFGVRTHLSRHKHIKQIDKACILLAAPIISLTISVALLFIGKVSGQVVLIIIAAIFSLINLLSLLPIKGSDGKRAYKIFKTSNKLTFFYCIMSFIVFIAYNCGMKNILDRTKGE